MTVKESSLQRAAKQSKSLECSFSGIDLSEFSTPAKTKAHATHSAELKERLKRNAQQRLIQDQEELKLAAAIQASRVKSNKKKASLGDLLVGMHDQEQRQESRMKLKKEPRRSDKRTKTEGRCAKKSDPPKRKGKKRAKY